MSDFVKKCVGCDEMQFHDITFGEKAPGWVGGVCSVIHGVLNL